MIRKRIDSTIEVWTYDYINDPYARGDEDINKEIVQIEYAFADRFMVEVVKKEEN